MNLTDSNIEVGDVIHNDVAPEYRYRVTHIGHFWDLVLSKSLNRFDYFNTTLINSDGHNSSADLLPSNIRFEYKALFETYNGPWVIMQNILTPNVYLMPLFADIILKKHNGGIFCREYPYKIYMKNPSNNLLDVLKNVGL